MLAALVSLAILLWNLLFKKRLLTIDRVDQRRIFYEEMNEFTKMSEEEQRFRLGNTGLPSFEEFWNYRLGASAVYVCLAVNE